MPGPGGGHDLGRQLADAQGCVTVKPGDPEHQAHSLGDIGFLPALRWEGVGRPYGPDPWGVMLEIGQRR
jgi:hypothetical protein